jgi:hypothetical protein
MKDGITKKIILSPFHLIRKILDVAKNHCVPIRPPFDIYDKYEIEELNKCYDHFKDKFKTAIFLDKNFREFAIKRAIENDKKQEKFYLEFGVYKGKTINELSRFVNKIYGFDSFEGLKEDWIGRLSAPKGTFDLSKKIPKFNKNVIPISGWIQDTLENFLTKNSPSINFVHIDVDTYDTTKFILTKIKPYLSNNSIILFDELYNFPGWDVGEYKALKEVFNENEFKYIMFARNAYCVAIEYQKNEKN